MSPGNTVLKDKARASYLGLAIGDALGATVEFMTPAEIKANYGKHKDIIGGGWLKLKPGKVTDDTEMSLALGVALLSCGQVNADAIAEAFSEWMRSKPVDIGNTVRRGLVYYRNHGETSVPKSEFNAGNGACMRSLPIALAMLGAEPEKVQLASKLQSHITHHSDLSDAGTEHVIELTQMALRGKSLDELKHHSLRFTAAHPLYQFTGNSMFNPSGYIVETIKAVLQALYTSYDFESCLIDVVNRGGDADTTGAIAGMLAGALYGMDSIPGRWLRKLDQNISTLCTTQAEDLIAIAPLSFTCIETSPTKQKQSTGLLMSISGE